MKSTLQTTRPRGDARRSALAWQTVRQYLGEDVERFLRANHVQLVALAPGETYGATSPALSRLAINVDAWPAPPAGLFVVEERTVYLRSISAMTVIHETGHALDCALGGGVYRSSTCPRLRRLFAEAPGFVTPYAASGADEWFAEGVRALVHANDSRQGYWPRVSAFRFFETDPHGAAYVEAALAEAAALGRREAPAQTPASADCYTAVSALRVPLAATLVENSEGVADDRIAAALDGYKLELDVLDKRGDEHEVAVILRRSAVETILDAKARELASYVLTPPRSPYAARRAKALAESVSFMPDYLLGIDQRVRRWYWVEADDEAAAIAELTRAAEEEPGLLLDEDSNSEERVRYDGQEETCETTFDPQSIGDACEERERPVAVSFMPGDEATRQHAKTCPVAGAARELASYVLYDDALVDVGICPEKEACVARMEALARFLDDATSEGVPADDAGLPIVSCLPGGACACAALPADQRATGHHPDCDLWNPHAAPLDESAPDLCPEHGPHDEDYCPGCTARREALQAAILAAVPLLADAADADDLAPRVADELERRGYALIGPGGIKLAALVEGGIIQELRTNIPEPFFAPFSTRDEDFVQDGGLDDDQLADQAAALALFEALGHVVF